MDRQQAKQVIGEIARSEGVDESEVRKEINCAIFHGFLNSESNSLWIKLFGKEKLPDPEEFLIALSYLMAQKWQ